jgi:1,4-dihydroxy-2-naphthoyl-CoA hydrolase
MDMMTHFKENPLPFAKLLGIDLVSVASERVLAHMTVRDDLCTQPAVLHGGAIMAFADTLGALGSMANLDPGVSTVTIYSHTNFVGPAPLAVRLIAEATPVHLGRRVMVWQTRMTTQDGTLVAVTTQGQLLVTPGGEPASRGSSLQAEKPARKGV